MGDNILLRESSASDNLSSGGCEVSKVSTVARGSDYCLAYGVGGEVGDESSRHSGVVVGDGPHLHYQSLPKILQVHRTAAQGHGLEHRYRVLEGARDVPSSANWKSDPNQRTTLLPRGVESDLPC